MEVTYHVVQFDVDPGTFSLLDVGPAGYEQRFDISPVDPGLGGPHEDRLQGLAVLLPHLSKISLYDITVKAAGGIVKLRSVRAQCRDEQSTELPRPPLSTLDYQPRRVAVSPVHPQLPRHRGSAG